jgi:glycosyltransferase involved in cell wall biosynthesis
MPTYNRASFIGDTIRSVLVQTYPDWELIIIDDASTDDTYDVIKDFISPHILYVKNEKNLGIAASRNIAVSKARGQYIAMLDSDDIWLDKEKLVKQVSFLEKNTDYALVGTWVRKIDQNGASIGEMTFATDDRAIRQAMLCRNQFVQSSVLFVKKVAEKAGLYDLALLVDEDYDLWLAIGKIYKFANLSDFTTGYRVHTGSIIRRKKLLAAQLHLSIIKKYRYDYPEYFRAKIKGIIRLLLSYL